MDLRREISEPLVRGEVKTVVEAVRKACEEKENPKLILEEGLTLLPRWGQPEDVARAVMSIASGALPYSTGETIYVDGGMHNPHF